MSAVDLLVIAKEPLSGRSKTRLSPPLTPEEAASLAEAALTDTLETVAQVDASRHVLVLDGSPGEWLPSGYEVVQQTGGGLDSRLVGAFASVTGRALLVGMDTPQISVEVLETAIERLLEDERDAVLGLAEDGGWWAIGLDRPSPDVFLGVPMSTDRTGSAQIARLEKLGLSWAELPTLRDFDQIEDARAVALEHPGLRFSRRLKEIEAKWTPAG